jgi:hypothetical protein
MTEPISVDSTAKSIKRLTLGVWILSILTLGNLIISIVAFLHPPFLARRIMASLPEPKVSSSSHAREDDYNGFYDWPLEKQIQTASVIAVGKWQKEDKKLKCIIVEILKQKPGIKFYYKVGDEYTSGSFYPKGDANYLDGQVMFFTGSPPMCRYSVSYSEDRVTGFGDMPIDELRRMIKKENTEPSAAANASEPRR